MGVAGLADLLNAKRLTILANDVGHGAFGQQDSGCQNSDLVADHPVEIEERLGLQGHLMPCI